MAIAAEPTVQNGRSRGTKRPLDARTVLRVVAITLVVLGQSGYLLIWLGIRAWGEITLTFGNWGPSWLLWFERWVEPVVILGVIVVVGVVLWRETTRGEDVRERVSAPPGR
jgi:uncharacterized protein involved in cysteine biosynthesis